MGEYIMGKSKVLMLIGGILGIAGGAMLIIASIGFLSQLPAVIVFMAGEGATLGDYGISESLIHGIMYSTIAIGSGAILMGVLLIMRKKIAAYILLVIAGYVFVGNLVNLYDEFLTVGSGWVIIDVYLVQTLLNFGDPIILIAGGVLGLIGVLQHDD